MGRGTKGREEREGGGERERKGQRFYIEYRKLPVTLFWL